MNKMIDRGDNTGGNLISRNTGGNVTGNTGGN
jgi:hypothetical protein